RSRDRRGTWECRPSISRTCLSLGAYIRAREVLRRLLHHTGQVSAELRVAPRPPQVRLAREDSTTTRARLDDGRFRGARALEAPEEVALVGVARDVEALERAAAVRASLVREGPLPGQAAEGHELAGR